MSESGKELVEDLEEFCPSYRLYLRPLCKINITVQLPNLHSVNSQSMGQSISNWEVMEKLRALAKPVEFSQWKVIKSSLEFYRFQADVPSRADVKRVLPRLNGSHLKLSGFSDSLLVKASEAKLDFPRRYDWEAFFRDAKDMNEMLPGERPDTVHLQHLPIRWFSESNTHSTTDSETNKGVSNLRPSPSVLKKVFEVFGDVREVDIPMLSPLYEGPHLIATSSSSLPASNPQAFLLGELGPQLTFEAYVQYKDFLSFVRCMDALRGKCLVQVHSPTATPSDTFSGGVSSTSSDLAEQLAKHSKAIRSAEIKVDFDRTKHLSRGSIEKRRLTEKRHWAQLERQRQKEEAEKRLQEQQLLEEERRKQEEELERDARRKAREEARRARAEERRQRKEEEERQLKMKIEERRGELAQRELHATRLLTELLQRAKVREERRLVEQWERELAEESARLAEEERRREAEKVKKAEEKERRRRQRLLEKEEILRNKIIKKMQEAERRESKNHIKRLKKVHASSRERRNS